MNALTDLERWPGLVEFAREWLGSAWWPHDWICKNREQAAIPDTPAGRHLVADWLGAGERCPAMPHSLDRTGLTFYRGGECGCRDTGYLRPPAPHDWARELPGALVKSMELVAEGRPPLVGVLGEWRRDEDSWSRYDAGTAWAYVYDRANSHGVAWRAPGGLRGPETGTAGMAAADKAAQDTYWLLGPKEEG